ncbi:MAG: hypothetical protein ACLQLG_11055 [Thermoguttaceae bacterium]
MTATEDPAHPILDRPWEYDITAFSYVRPDDGTEPYIDMTLRKDRVVRRLRFFSPREIEIQKGFPLPTRGMYFSDVRARGMEGLGVRVGDFEASPGKVRFWARELVDLDQTKEITG